MFCWQQWSIEGTPQGPSAFHAGDRSGEALATLARHKRAVVARELARRCTRATIERPITPRQSFCRAGTDSVARSAFRSLQIQLAQLVGQQPRSRHQTRSQAESW